MPAFSPQPLRDLTESLQWKPGATTLSGRAANLVVNDALHELDIAFTDYMGAPPVPSLLTYAKHASRTVGSQLARLEAVMRFLRYLDFNALADIRRDAMRRETVRGQARIMLLELARNPFRFYRTLSVLRHAIQWGNLQAYQSLVPAFSTFLEAETAGADGTVALRRAGYGEPPLDPQSLVLRAFQMYRAARELGDEVEDDNGADQRNPDRLRRLDLRRSIAFNATLTLSLHEQMLFQASECYEDAMVQRVVGKLTRSLVIEDPVDTMYLLPDGGNWAQFTDRMGLTEVDPPGDVRLIDPAGVPRCYRLQDNRAAGTIYDYLSSRFLDSEAAAGIAAAPLPLPAYDDGEGRALDRLLQSYRRVRGEYRP